MRRYLFLLFLIIPALEIYAILQVGEVIGGLWTFLLLLASSLAGAYLVKREGRRTLQQIQRDLSTGIPPGEALLDGACVLVGGALLLTPGFLTDALGIVLLLPGFRSIAKNILKRWLMKKAMNGSFFFRRF